jgi:hypothetical protein
MESEQSANKHDACDDGEDEGDYVPSGADVLWAPLCGLLELDRQKESQSRYYASVPVSAIVNSIGRCAHDYLETRTSFLKTNPAMLALGLADEKGHAKRTARALCDMALQDNLIGLLTALQDHLHPGIETSDLRSAIMDDDEYNGILRAFMPPDRWQVVVKIATDDSIPEDVKLSDLPFAHPLLADIVRCGKDLLVSNAISEVSGKVGMKTGCTHDHRRSDETLHRRSSAVLPSRKHPSHEYIEEHLPAARKANNLNLAVRHGRQQEEGCDITTVGRMRTEQLGSLQPYQGERLPCNLHWDELEPEQQSLVRSLGFDAATWVHNVWSKVMTWTALTKQPLLMRAAKALGFSGDSWWGELQPTAPSTVLLTDASTAAQEAEKQAQLHEAEAFQRLVESGDAEEEDIVENSQPEPSLPSLAPTVDYHEFEQLSSADKRRRLLVGTVISMAWGVAVGGELTFYLAIVVEPKLSGSNATGPQSVRIRWLREVDGEDCVYCLETRGTKSEPWHKEQNRAIAKIIDTPRIESLPNAADGTRRWRLLGQQPASVTASAKALAKAPAQVQLKAMACMPAKAHAASSSSSSAVLHAVSPTNAPGLFEDDAASQMDDGVLLKKVEPFKPPAIREPPPRSVLRGPLGQRRGDVGYLSDEESEWLTDVQLYNACLMLLSMPKQLRSGSRVIIKAPRSLDKLLAKNDGTFFQLPGVKSVLTGDEAGRKGIVAVQFCEALHWRFLVLWGQESVRRNMWNLLFPPPAAYVCC